MRARSADESSGDDAKTQLTAPMMVPTTLTPRTPKPSTRRTFASFAMASIAVGRGVRHARADRPVRAAVLARVVAVERAATAVEVEVRPARVGAAALDRGVARVDGHTGAA